MKPDENSVSISPSISGSSLGGILMLTLLGILVVCLGICPGWLIEVVKSLNP